MNPHIDPVYWWLTALTLPLWLHALWWNVAATRHGVLETVRMRAATSMLALIYFVGACVLLFSNVNPARWSDVMRGVGVIALPVVWSLPAMLSVRMGDKIRATNKKIIDRHDMES